MSTYRERTTRRKPINTREKNIYTGKENTKYRTKRKTHSDRERDVIHHLTTLFLAENILMNQLEYFILLEQLNIISLSNDIK